MSCPVSRTACVLAAGLLLLAGPGARAPADEETSWTALAGLDSVRLARAKFRAARPNLGELAKARLAAARVEDGARWRGFLAGRETLDITLGAAERRLHAELALAVNDTDRIAACERYLVRVRNLDDVNRLKYAAGRVAMQDAAQARCARLGAEIRLALVRRGDGPARSLPGGLASLWDSDLNGEWNYRDVAGGTAGTVVNILDPNAVTFRQARAHAKIDRVGVRALAEARLKMAETAEAERLKAFLAGRETLVLFTDSSLLRLECKLALIGPDGDAVAAHELHWRHAKYAADVNWLGYKAGRVAPQDHLQAVFHRLEAELWLVQARARRGQVAAPGVPRGSRTAHEVAWLQHLQEDAGPRLSRDANAALFATTSARVGPLARARYEAARNELNERVKGFLAGRETLDAIVVCRHRLSRAELALCNTPGERVAVYERQWEQAWFAEEVHQLKYNSGRVAIQDYAQSQYERLDAEIRLAQARAGK